MAEQRDQDPSVTEGHQQPPVAEAREPLLRVRNLTKTFASSSGIASLGRNRTVVQALSDVSFDVYPGEVLSLVGESGCGKSTLGRCLLRLLEPTAGTVEFEGEDVLAKRGKQLRELRSRMQIVFQNPYSSLHPRMRVEELIAEPVLVQGASKATARAKAMELLERVQLGTEAARRYPHEFSGGQRQRIAIARALSVDPKFVVLDEPVSALDVSVQAEVLHFLRELQDDFGYTYLFIGHDLSVVNYVSDRVAVMHLGKIVEVGTRDEVLEKATHPYTHSLLSAAPIPDPDKEAQRDRILLEGELPNPANPPSGCRFRTRCWKAQDICAAEEPELMDRGFSHASACHFAAVRSA